jgi:hypothetical protein
LPRNPIRRDTRLPAEPIAITREMESGNRNPSAPLQPIETTIADAGLLRDVGETPCPPDTALAVDVLIEPIFGTLF